jgi:hypothetical protein
LDIRGEISRLKREREGAADDEAREMRHLDGHWKESWV